MQGRGLACRIMHFCNSLQQNNGIVALARPDAGRKNACRFDEETFVLHTVHVIGHMAPWTHACERQTVNLNMKVNHADNGLLCMLGSDDISMRAPEPSSMQCCLCLKDTVGVAEDILDQACHGLCASLLAKQTNIPLRELVLHGKKLCCQGFANHSRFV